MKKIFLSLILVAASSVCFAQNFGVKAGGNINEIAGCASSDNKAINIGAYVGGVIEVGLPVANLGVRFEPMFTMQGATRNREVLKVKWTDKYQFDYLALPILIDYKFLGGSLVLMAGPQVGYAVNAKQVSKGESNENTINYSKDDVSFFDAGLTLGATYMVTRNLGVDLRYNFGLTNILKDTDTIWQNRVASIGVCYMF